MLLHETESVWGWSGEQQHPRGSAQGTPCRQAPARATASLPTLTLCQRLHFNTRVVAPVVRRGRCPDLENIEGARLQVIHCHGC